MEEVVVVGIIVGMHVARLILLKTSNMVSRRVGYGSCMYFCQ